MNLLHPFFQLFWVAFCALSLMAQTRLLLGQSTALGWLDGFVFGGTVFGYYCTHPKVLYRKIAWGAGFLGGICFLMPLIDSPRSFWRQLVGLIPVVFWLAYYGFKRPGNSGLRSKLLAKPLTIALTWAWVTVLLPTQPTQWPNLCFLLLGRAAFIFALALAYDLCDSDYDHRYGLKTLTKELGFEQSFVLIYSSLGLAACCVGTNLYLQIYTLPKALGLFLSLGFCAWWLRYLLQERVWLAWQKPLIDGLMVLQYLLVLLLSKFPYSTL